MKKHLSRRTFLKNNTLVSAGIVSTYTLSMEKLVPASLQIINNDLALLGGNPVRTKDWPSWPMWIAEEDEQMLLEVMRSGVWSRNKVVKEFEEKWAETVGSRRCLAVVNGTNALNTALAQLDIGWGDEVLVTPYSFIASISCILFNGAIPVFVDVDPETFQMDPKKIEEKITSNTKAILPVHILGMPCDMTSIMSIAKKHSLLVVEDACQGWLAEVKGKKVGTIGDAGCFSFQNSKHLPIGEGGAIVSDDEDFIDRCYSFHNFGHPHGSVVGGTSPGSVMIGTKLRLTEYQAAIGLAQLKRLQSQTELRWENAQYLNSLMKELAGIKNYRLYPEVTKAAHHLFAFRYVSDEFKELPREKFLEALRAEGIPCSPGYSPLNKMACIEYAFNNRHFKKFYESNRINYENYMENNQCPLNDQLCQDAVWLPQTVLLGDREDMNQIAAAISKIHTHADKIK